MPDLTFWRLELFKDFSGEKANGGGEEVEEEEGTKGREDGFQQSKLNLPFLIFLPYFIGF